MIKIGALFPVNFYVDEIARSSMLPYFHLQNFRAPSHGTSGTQHSRYLPVSVCLPFSLSARLLLPRDTSLRGYGRVVKIGACFVDELVGVFHRSLQITKMSWVFFVLGFEF
jgi:hypothetical protein